MNSGYYSLTFDKFSSTCNLIKVGDIFLCSFFLTLSTSLEESKRLLVIFVLALSSEGFGLDASVILSTKTNIIKFQFSRSPPSCD